jgi:chromosome segregation protein
VANEAAARARATATERDDVTERARAARERLAGLERSLAEREGVAPAARALAEAGERLALAALEVEPGAERAVAAALAWRASALLVDDARAGYALLERARTEGLGSLAVLVRSVRPESPTTIAPVPDARPLVELVSGPEDARRLLDGIWLVDPTRLLEATTGVAITFEGHGYDAAHGELWFADETPESVLLEMDARRRALVDEANELDARAATAGVEAEKAAAHAAEAEAAFAAVAHLRDRPLDVAQLGRLATVAGGCEDLLARAVAVATRLEEPLGVAAGSGSQRVGELTEEIRRLATLEADAQRAVTEATRRAQAAEVVVVRLGGVVEGVAADGDREVLTEEAAEALAASELAAAGAREAADRARLADAALVERAPRRSTLDVDLAGRLASVVAQATEVLERAARSAGRLEAPVRARADAGARRAGELGVRLRELGAEEVELRRRADEAAERATAVEVELARLDGEAEEAQRRHDDALASGTEPVEEQSSDLGRDELAARIQRLEARREALGKVNPLAKEEYEAEKERLEELAAQRADLEESLAEIEKLRDELAATVQQRFDETFATVAATFEEVATTLFPGGEGRLRLVEPGDDEGEPGVEVELRPAGKRITRLTLLSGGEKALGAISFLFALFLAKPCPFYLLDEVEAALDDANIARFVELLRRYADQAQFIVITHQKRTMEAADVLYGVTMGGDGVSQIVSRRLPRDDRAAVAASA